MSISKDRQGYLENLSLMTVPQLMELLNRQERILSKKNFLSTLPDKGEKSKAFADKLKKLIDERRGKEPRFQNSDQDIGLENAKIEEGIQSDLNSREEAMLGILGSRNEENTTYRLESEKSKLHSSIQEQKSSTNETDPDDLLQQMNELSFGTKIPENEDPYVNSYERVIKKAELDPKTIQNKFVPNRPRSDRESRPPTPPWTKPPTQTPKVKEESAVRPPVYSHESTKLISIEESLQLIEQQKKRRELQTAERAAQRLADQLSAPNKMDKYQPINTDMRYRQPQEEVDGGDRDSDDFASDEDEGS